MAKSPPPPDLVQISARVPRELANALKLAATTREISGRQPHTQAGMIETALRAWLQREGHLPK
jgi:hypothetical protein